jgi:phosphoribosylformylglycinamidine synthase
LNSLLENNQIIFKYCSKDGSFEEQYNYNGSLMNIAGIINKEGNVLGMMPHPERCTNPVLGKTDGSLIFNSVAKNIFQMKVDPALA